MLLLMLRIIILSNTIAQFPISDDNYYCARICGFKAYLKIYYRKH